MILNFRQGIVSYDLTSAPFIATGTSVTLNIGSQPIVVSMAQGTSNYSYAETTAQSDCWVVPTISNPYWLYWDFNSSNFARTFGFTSLQPIIGANAPTSPVQGQMWYNTATFQNYEYTAGGWTEVLRVFAALYQPTYPAGMKFVSLGNQPPLNSITPDFRGTQIGVNVASAASGSVIVDYTGLPIRKNDGTFFTTEDDVFANNAAVTALRLESNVYTTISTDSSTITQYQVVALQSDGSVQLGSYDDAGLTVIGMAIQTLLPNEAGAICLEGSITNTVSWDWSGNVGNLLWVAGGNSADPNASPGALVPIDPNVSNPTLYPTPRVPVARVLSPFSILFLQGIGTKGDPGPPGQGIDDVVPATSIIAGIVTLSTDGGVLANPTNVVVSELDPRLTNPRIALASSVLAATQITVAPDSPSGTTTANVQLALQALGLNKLSLSGGTLTGILVLAGDPTSTFQAATKQYVDNSIGGLNLDYVALSGSTMTGPLILNSNPSQNLQAATKQYVDSIATGLTFLPNVVVASTSLDTTSGGSLNSVGYIGSPTYTLTNVGTLAALMIDSVSLSVGQRVLIKDLSSGNGVGISADQNGIYEVTVAGSGSVPWILTRDVKTVPPNILKSGTFVFVTQGTVNSNTGWVLATANPITIDTTPLQFVIFSSTAAIVSSGVTNALGYVPVGPFAVTSTTSGITVSGSPVQGGAPSGVVLSLSTELLGLNALSTIGFVQRTGVGNYIASVLTSNQITAALGYVPLSTGTINTTAPLAGGGSLVGSLTLTIDPFIGSAPGAVPLSPGGTSAFLRADGSWSIPPGRGGQVSSVGLSTTTTGLVLGGTNPITTTGVITVNLNNELQGLSTLSTTGFIQRTGTATYTAAPLSFTLTGDITGTGTNTIATTLATVNSTPGTYGNSTTIPVIGVNTKGLITSSTQTAISINALLPSQTGNAGEFLTTNGSVLSWAPSVVIPGGSTNQIQFNTSGVFGASAGLTWITAGSSSSLNLGRPGVDTTAYLSTNNTSGVPINLNITGGNIQINSATASSVGPGSYITILAGDGNGTGAGGNIIVQGGTAPAGNQGGNINIAGGQSTTGTGGSITITGGYSSSGFGGNVTIATTPNSQGDYVNRLEIANTGEWLINNSSSVAGQILTSGGPGASPTWNYGKNNDVLFSTATQTIFNTVVVQTTAKTAFPNGTVYLQVFVNGIQQREDNSAGTGFSPNSSGQFYVSGGHQITFFTGLVANDEVTIYQLF
jgi:hypothetical protein